MKIKLRDGSIGTVTTTSDTRFRKDRQEAKLSDFKVGDTVMVRGDSAGDDKWTAQMIASAPSQAEVQERMKQEITAAVVGLREDLARVKAAARRRLSSAPTGRAMRF